MQTDLPGSIQT